MSGLRVTQALWIVSTILFVFGASRTENINALVGAIVGVVTFTAGIVWCEIVIQGNRRKQEHAKLMMELRRIKQ